PGRAFVGTGDRNSECIGQGTRDLSGPLSSLLVQTERTGEGRQLFACGDCRSHVHTSTPSWRSEAISSSASSKTSRHTSTVCSPSSGAGVRGTASTPDMRNGGAL